MVISFSAVFILVKGGLNVIVAFFTTYVRAGVILNAPGNYHGEDIKIETVNDIILPFSCGGH